MWYQLQLKPTCSRLAVLKYELSLSINNASNHVSTSKHYHLFPKQKLLQTNSLVTSMTFMFLSANFKLFSSERDKKVVSAVKLLTTIYRYRIALYQYNGRRLSPPLLI